MDEQEKATRDMQHGELISTLRNINMTLNSINNSLQSIYNRGNTVVDTWSIARELQKFNEIFAKLGEEADLVEGYRLMQQARAKQLKDEEEKKRQADAIKKAFLDRAPF